VFYVSLVLEYLSHTIYTHVNSITKSGKKGERSREEEKERQRRERQRFFRWNAEMPMTTVRVSERTCIKVHCYTEGRKRNSVTQ
jgi:hypothetical protein